MLNAMGKNTCLQEEALARTTLREVQDLVTGALAGPKGSCEGGEELVVRKALPEPIYTQPALEALLGTPLETVFAGNASQLRCLAVAAENGAHCVAMHLLLQTADLACGPAPVAHVNAPAFGGHSLGPLHRKAGRQAGACTCQRQPPKRLGRAAADARSRPAARRDKDAEVGVLCTCAAGGFRLQQRACHVYAEAARVPAFKAICDSGAPAPDRAAQLGALMDSSQASCRCAEATPMCNASTRRQIWCQPLSGQNCGR